MYRLNYAEYSFYSVLRVQSPDFAEKVNFLDRFNLHLDGVAIVGIQVRVRDDALHHVALGDVSLAVVRGGNELE